MEYYLITYKCVYKDTHPSSYGYAISEDPFKWLLSTQNCSIATYFIVHTLKITKEQAINNVGRLRGM